MGLVATTGILIAQLLWTKEAFTIEEKKFSQKAHIALLNVVEHLYEGTNHEVPANNPVKKVANDYYIVNVDNDFEPEILEHYLKVEFGKIGITTDFEYAMYNCQSDEMVYGNYISFSNKTPKKTSIHFPKHKNLIYYFAVRFPNETSYLFNSLRFWFVLSFALVIILVVYVYSIYTIIQQKKYSELQRDFINNMTHEFKTPLSSILIASNYLHQQESIKKDPKLEKYSKIIIDQTHKLNHHIEKVLNVAKSDNSALVLDKQQTAIVPILKSVIDNIQLKYPETSITINTNSDNYMIEADPFHFTNLVYNLIDNSIKYCECEPEIAIFLSEDNKQLKMEFVDNGIGVANKNISFIFDKFYRIPSTKSNEVSGFGLGLYYVKKICTQHQWKITAKNNTEKGITITILIPNK